MITFGWKALILSKSNDSILEMVPPPMPWKDTFPWAKFMLWAYCDVESRELRWSESEAGGLPPENPRASTTDNVEGMIALFHELLGPIFDLKAFKQEFPKIMNDFNKWIDPDIPFYYWSGIHERFHLKALPSFNEPSQSGIGCLDRVVISRRADPGMFVAYHANFPRRVTWWAYFVSSSALKPTCLNPVP